MNWIVITSPGVTGASVVIQPVPPPMELGTLQGESGPSKPVPASSAVPPAQKLNPGVPPAQPVGPATQRSKKLRLTDPGVPLGSKTMSWLLAMPEAVVLRSTAQMSLYWVHAYSGYSAEKNM